MFKFVLRLNFSATKRIFNPVEQNFKYARSLVTASAVETTADSEPKWQLLAAASITRTPIICPELKPIEKEYKELVLTKEEEQSLLSSHEQRLQEDKIRNDLIGHGDQDHINLEEAAKQTGEEFEDASLEELKSFQFGSRVTESDISKDFSSLNRALDRSLFLIVNQKLGSQHHWVFPQTPWIPGETLRQSCERIVKEICEPKLKVKIIGNSPCGFYKYKYPKEIRKKGFIGAKVFFFPAHVLAFDSTGLDSKEDASFAASLWLTRDELKHKVGKSYYQAVSNFIISDT